MMSSNLLSILLLICLSCLVSASERLVTLDELQTKNGKDDPLIWLSILGQVYDVTEGKEYYGPGESYHSLTAADTSVPFVTGTFTPEEAKRDPVELGDSELTGILEWQSFYAGSDKYHLVGKLVDPRFYDENGNEQPSLTKVLERIEIIKKVEEEKKAAKEANKKARLQAQQAAEQEI